MEALYSDGKALYFYGKPVQEDQEALNDNKESLRNDGKRQKTKKNRKVHPKH